MDLKENPPLLRPSKSDSILHALPLFLYELAIVAADVIHSSVNNFSEVISKSIITSRNIRNF